MSAMNRVRIIGRHVGDDGKTYVTVRNAHGRTYGLREIGNRKSWNRFQLKGGQKFRFAHQAAAHLDGEQLARFVAERKARAERAEHLRLRAEMMEQNKERMLARLLTLWNARGEYRGKKLA